MTPRVRGITYGLLCGVASVLIAIYGATYDEPRLDPEVMKPVQRGIGTRGKYNIAGYMSNVTGVESIGYPIVHGRCPCGATVYGIDNVCIGQCPCQDLPAEFTVIRSPYLQKAMLKGSMKENMTYPVEFVQTEPAYLCYDDRTGNPGMIAVRYTGTIRGEARYVPTTQVKESSK